MTNRQKYDKIFNDLFKNTGKELNPDFTFEAIEEWDSLLHMELISQLEEQFDIMFETMDILQYGSYENGIKILQKYGVDIQ